MTRCSKLLAVGRSKVTCCNLAVLLTMGIAPGCSNRSDGGGIGQPMSWTGGLWEDKVGNFGIFLSSFTNECAMKKAGTSKANSTILEMDLTPPTGQTTVPPGTYPILANDAPGAVTAQLKVHNATCDDTKTDATGGSVTLTSALGVETNGVGTAAVSGLYDIQFADGNQSGAFSAVSFCDNLQVGTGPSCVP